MGGQGRCRAVVYEIQEALWVGNVDACMRALVDSQVNDNESDHQG
jgi:hypothetical protein